jgi:uncharacterized protein (TIGR00255 family)
MTGFARDVSSTPLGEAVWEIRSVNHRFLEPHFRLHDTVRHLEPRLREALRKALSRGKVDVSFKWQARPGAQQLQLDRPLLEDVLRLTREVQSVSGSTVQVDPLALLQWPGILRQPDTDQDTLDGALMQGFIAALKKLKITRLDEGRAMADILLQKLDALALEARHIRDAMPALLDAWHNRLRQRLEGLEVEADPQRLEQELALQATRADITEELDRLDNHIAEVRKSLQQKGPTGRRLDFLVQELNREANTTASKAMHTDTAQSAVNMKVLIEQMREQIQNIE